MTSPFQLEAGTIFAGEFRVVRALSEGGMGAVYVVEQIATGKQRALKIMHPQLVNDATMRARFVQEARIGARIESDHVVDVLDAGIDSATSIPWLVMELLAGETLLDRVETRGPRPRAEVAEIFGQLCHALGAAHDVGIVHRDLKPENVFLAVPRREGVPFIVKVLDFGIAKLVADAGRKERTTGAVGSPLWMAPEQANAEGAITPATDVWALGLLAFWLLTGKEFWKAAHAAEINPMALIVEAITEAPPAASVRAKELGVELLVPPGFDAWFSQCVCHDVRARFSNARAARGALERLLLGKEPVDAAPETRRAEVAVPELELPSAPAPKPKKAESPREVKIEMASAPPPAVSKPSSSSRSHAALSPRRTPIELAANPARATGSPVTRPRHPVVRAMEAGEAERPVPWKGIAIGGVLVLAGLVAAQRFFWTRDAAKPTASTAASAGESAPAASKSIARPSCPAGMAYFAGGQDDHGARVEPFCLDVSEVTVDEYAQCVKSKTCAPAHPRGNWPATSAGAAVRNTACNAGRDAHGAHPINCVDWSQAVAYCAARGKKLPSDAQWSWAAHRGQERAKYPWGNDAPDVHLCWSGMAKRAETCKVGAFPKGDAEGGVHDLAGDVAEWTSTEAGDDERLYCGSDFTDGAGGAAMYMLGECSRARTNAESALLGFRCASAP